MNLHSHPVRRGLFIQIKKHQTNPGLRGWTHTQLARISTQRWFQSLSFSTKDKMFVSGQSSEHGMLMCFIIRTYWKGFQIASQKVSWSGAPFFKLVNAFLFDVSFSPLGRKKYPVGTHKVSSSTPGSSSEMSPEASPGGGPHLEGSSEFKDLCWSHCFERHCRSQWGHHFKGWIIERWIHRESGFLKIGAKAPAQSSKSFVRMGSSGWRLERGERQIVTLGFLKCVYLFSETLQLP